MSAASDPTTHKDQSLTARSSVTVVTFVGLIYVTIISFVTVVSTFTCGNTGSGVLRYFLQVTNHSAIVASKLFPRVTMPTLITLRLGFYFVSYFLLSVSQSG